MSYLAAVDAGGTNTRAIALCVETGELRQARAAGANWTVHGAAVCQERITAAITHAFPRNVTPSALAVCVAGYYPPDHAPTAEAWLGERWPGVPAQVLPDVVGAWAGALCGEPGIVVISGTGSIAYGRNAAGQDARAGGWGPLFGDEGSGFAVGVAALRLLAATVDGMEPESALAGRLIQRWPELGADLRTWLRGIYRAGWAREQVAALAREVVEAAQEEDAGAFRIIQDAACQLTRQAEAVASQLHAYGLALALQGGLGSSDVMRRAVIEQAPYQRAGLQLVPPSFGPLEGALLLAAELAGGAELRHRVREILTGREADEHGAH